jgi:hypothetical protein
VVLPTEAHFAIMWSIYGSTGGTSGSIAATGVGEDSTSSPTGGWVENRAGQIMRQGNTEILTRTIGYHYYQVLEMGGSGVTFYNTKFRMAVLG